MARGLLRDWSLYDTDSNREIVAWCKILKASENGYK
jgi:hypothetical protein